MLPRDFGIIIIFFKIITLGSCQPNCTFEYLRYYGYASDGNCCAQHLDGWMQRKIGIFRDHQRQSEGKNSNTRGSSNVLRIQYEKLNTWGDICRRWKAAAVCIHALIPDCDMGVVYTALRDRAALHFYSEKYSMANGITAFYDRSCQDGVLKANIKHMLRSVDIDMQCLNKTQRKEFNSCSQKIEAEASFYDSSIKLNDSVVSPYLYRLAKDMLICMRTVVLSSSCNLAASNVYMHIARLHLPTMFNVSNIEIPDKPDYKLQSHERSTVGVYGDPHLMVLYDDKLHTCAATGLQIYLSNTVIHLTGENTEIQSSSNTKIRPTTLCLIQILFYSVDGKRFIGRYRAEDGHLPKTFMNQETKIGDGSDEVIVESGLYNKTVIVHKGLGMIVILRSTQGNYFFSLRAAESLLNQSSGLLVAGCPKDQLISREEVIRRKRGAAFPSNMQNACDQIGDKDFKDICEFDITMTGNRMFAMMAKEAVNDTVVVEDRDMVLRKSAIPSSSSYIMYNAWILLLLVTTSYISCDIK